MPNRDILGEIDGYLERIINIVGLELKDTKEDQDGVSALTTIRRSAEASRNTVQIMRKYRTLRNRAIFLYYPDTDEFVEAKKQTRMKIARRLLIQEGLISEDSNSTEA